MGKILLFYKYIHLEYPKRILKWQQKLCQELNLNGRILLATEGINGTVGGTQEDIDRYVNIMHSNPLFADIDFKYSDGNADCFPRLQITIRDEIVHTGLEKSISTANTGKHLDPTQVHELIKRKPDDLIIFDARNDYEWKIGRFNNAILPPIGNFRDLPEYIDNNLEQFKDKQVLMYCTGGVRCERASAYLNTKNIAKEVFQINGGIARYVEQYPDGYFRGKNYVFDNRIGIRANNDILSSCELCDSACDDYINCINVVCNKHFISCTECRESFNYSCSIQCRDLITTDKVRIRPNFEQKNTK